MAANYVFMYTCVFIVFVCACVYICLSPQGTTPDDMPSWMAALHKKLNNSRTHQNIRLFIARLISNRPKVYFTFLPPPPYPFLRPYLSFLLPLHKLPSTIPFFTLPPPPCPSYQIFQPYAKYWLPGLVQLIVGGAHGGEGLHYFVVDLLVTILSWSTTAVLEVRRRDAKVLHCKTFDGVLQLERCHETCKMPSFCMCKELT